MNGNKNINLFVNELSDSITDEDSLNKLLSKWYSEEIIENDDEKTCDNVLYSIYTVKELLKICKYYNIEGYVKMAKCKKQDIITNIVYFESLVENYEIVEKRKLMWFFMTELLKDPKLKQYIIWH